MMYERDQEHMFIEDFNEFAKIRAMNFIAEFNGTQNKKVSDFNIENNFEASIPMCDNCSKLRDNYASINHISYWIEGVLQNILGVLGVISNLAVIPILCSNSGDMKSIFNRLLMFLLLLHTFYIATSISIYNGRAHLYNHNWFKILFSSVLHSLRPILLYATIFITAIMARERNQAILHPGEYRNRNLSINPWIPGIKSMLLVLCGATIFSLPLFFETTTSNQDVGGLTEINATHFEYVRKEMKL